MHRQGPVLESALTLPVKQEYNMHKIVIMVEGLPNRAVDLVKARTTLGRRPFNDVVLDHLSVSGEHAALILAGEQVQLEDLGSTNGTVVNGEPVQKRILSQGDQIELGQVRIRFEHAQAGAALQSRIRITSGAGAGREVVLTKPVSTIGKPGVAVAAVTRRAQDYWLHLQEGLDALVLNGVPVGSDPVLLHAGDELVLAGIGMQFLQN